MEFWEYKPFLLAFGPFCKGLSQYQRAFLPSTVTAVDAKQQNPSELCKGYWIITRSQSRTFTSPEASRKTAGGKEPALILQVSSWKINTSVIGNNSNDQHQWNDQKLFPGNTNDQKSEYTFYKSWNSTPVLSKAIFGRMKLQPKNTTY